MQNLNFDSSRWTLFNNMLVIAISIYGFAMQNYEKDEASLFQKVLIELMAPIQSGTTSAKQSVSNAIDHYIKIVNTSKENVELKSKIDTLENKIFVLNEVQKENERLKQLLDFGKVIPRKKLLAQVVSRDSSNEFKTLRINKGENDGLKLLAPVITMTGLVGYIYRVTPNYSEVLTILDQNNRVDAIVARTRSHGIIEGFAGFNCKFKYVARTEKVEVGDEIITAGLGEIYPKGIKVGNISKIDITNSGITQKIEVQPSVDFHRLEEVVVLLEGEASEISNMDIEESFQKLNEQVSEK